MSRRSVAESKAEVPQTSSLLNVLQTPFLLDAHKRYHTSTMDVNKLFDVRDKVVLVTGGAKGLGRMISEGFVGAGARVYISSRDAKACDQAVKELNALGKGTAAAIPADFYKESECKRLAEELGKRESSMLCER